MQAVEKKVRQILRNAGQKAPPTDLARVLAYLRLHHERPWHLNTDVWEGLARPARGRTRIKGQEQALTTRGRWRLAHEIGHHVLHGAEPRLRGGSWDSHELELEADLFAAALLVPPPWLERAVREDEDAHPYLDLDSLAQAFRVGPRVMEKRLRQLGLLRGEVLGRM
ncbi:MAG: ImmA/IrrE family metallo-endopeptidase [Acidobacteria bacterium]|nr:ImmA/IrrE family metallo-endopeptidase [Acidobacteriota bacterium]